MAPALITFLVVLIAPLLLVATTLLERLIASPDLPVGITELKGKA